MDDKILLDNALARIEAKEGFSATIYKCPANKWSIGFGRNLEDNGISRAEAKMLALNDIIRAITFLTGCFQGWKDFTICQQVALIDMVYNLGPKGFLKFSRMILAIKKGDWKRAAEEALDSLWAQQVGVRAEEDAEFFLKENK